jgi:hypothetical protein
MGDTLEILSSGLSTENSKKAFAMFSFFFALLFFKKKNKPMADMTAKPPMTATAIITP